MSQMSNMRTPRKRSFSTDGAACVPGAGAGGGKALLAAVEAAVRHLVRHKEKIFIYRDIALSAGADDRCQQLRICRVRDVLDVDAIEITLEKMISLKREV